MVVYSNRLNLVYRLKLILFFLLKKSLFPFFLGYQSLSCFFPLRSGQESDQCPGPTSSALEKIGETNRDLRTFKKSKDFSKLPELSPGVRGSLYGGRGASIYMSFLPVSSPGGGILCFRNLGPLLWSLIHKNLDLRQRNCFLAPRQQKELLRVLCGASRPQQVVLFVLFLAFCQDRSSSSNAAVVSLRSSRDIIIPSSMTKVLI